MIKRILKLMAAVLCLALCLGGAAVAAVEGPIFEAALAVHKMLEA